MLALLYVAITFSQKSGYDPKDFVDLALRENYRMLSKKIETQNSTLDLAIAKAALRPKIDLSYSYQYNAIIPTSLVPNALTGSGEGNGIAGFTELQFGTNWQQDAGLRLAQPLFDGRLRQKVAEERIAEKLSSLKEQREKEELTYNVIQSLIALANTNAEFSSAKIDTLRTFKTFALFKARYDQGRLLRTELNRAMINHNNAKSTYLGLKDKLKNKQYTMALLLGDEGYRVFQDDVVFQLTSMIPQTLKKNQGSIHSLDSIILKNEDRLLVQKIATNRASRLPSVSLDAFLGANQFSQDFSPFEENTWFGNSFVSISLEMPILSSQGTRKKTMRLKQEQKIKALEISEEKQKRTLELKKLDNTIFLLESEIELLRQNVELLEENLSIYQTRFSNGRLNAYELNDQELIYQQSKSLLTAKTSELWGLLLDKYRNLGRLTEFLDDIP